MFRIPELFNSLACLKRFFGIARASDMEDGELKLCQDCGQPMIPCEDCGAWIKPCFLKMGMRHVCDFVPENVGRN